MPTVSVVVPTHNRSRLLRQTLASVSAQRDVDLDVVVVDDGSRDDTAAVIGSLHDARISVVRHVRALGVSAARNSGIRAARGEWIAFLDDDDLWSPDKLATQLNAARTGGRRWACSGSVTVTDGLQVVAGSPPSTADEINRLLPRRNAVPAGASNVLVHRELLEQAGEFDTRLRHMADWDLWIRLSALGLPAVVSEPDVAYRLHTDNASADAAEIEGEIAVIEERHASIRNGDTIDRAFVLRWAAWNLLRVGQRMAAARAYGHAVATGDPLSLGRAMMAIADPDVVERTLRRGLDGAWAERATRWLVNLVF